MSQPDGKGFLDKPRRVKFTFVPPECAPDAHVFGEYVGTDLGGNRFDICSKCGAERKMLPAPEDRT